MKTTTRRPRRPSLTPEQKRAARHARWLSRMSPDARTYWVGSAGESVLQAYREGRIREIGI